MALKLWIDLVDDASVNTLPENGSFKSSGNSFLSKKNPFSYVQNILIIADGCAFDIFNGEDWRQISNRGDIELNPLAAQDQGASFIPGTDYFVYLCLPDSGSPEIVISANATYPAGFSASNSRKIGGFHYGHIRIVDETWTPVNSTGTKYGSTGTIWQDNVTIGIIPNSVWDLKNRPKTLFGGLVKIGAICGSRFTRRALKRQLALCPGTALYPYPAGNCNQNTASFPLREPRGFANTILLNWPAGPVCASCHTRNGLRPLLAIPRGKTVPIITAGLKRQTVPGPGPDAGLIRLRVNMTKRPGSNPLPYRPITLWMP
jgi:hypothetical protein